MEWRSQRWVQVATGLLTAGVCTVLWAGTASAKFPAFELRVTTASVDAGEAIEVEATVDGQSTVDFTAAPGLVPPVSLYRTADLPMSADGPGDAKPIEDVSFTSDGDGVFRARLTVDEPGSYQLLSMGVWNYELVGYPAPIELSVTSADSPDERESGLPWPAIGVSLAAMSALATARASRVRRRVR